MCAHSWPVMDAQAARPSRQSDAAASQIQRSRAATPSLTHKASTVSTTDTFASATDGQGYYTDAADVSAYHDDVRSRFDSVPNTINGYGLDQRDGEARLPRSSCSRTDEQGDVMITNVHEPQITSPQLQANPQQPPIEAVASPSICSDRNACAEEAGKPTGCEQQSCVPDAYHRLARHAAIVGLLMFSAIWGTLAREGMVALNTYDGESVAPLIWAQAVGCLIMGVAIGANREPIERTYPPAYIMITTGLCGSITTFSKWMLDVFRAFGDQRHFDRGGLHNVMDALSQTAVTLGMALISVEAGVALSSVVNVEKLVAAFHHWRSRPGLHPSRTPRADLTDGESKTHMVQARPTLILDTCMFLLGLIFWIGCALLCALYGGFRHVTFSLVLAPAGTVARWYLSRLNTHALSRRFSLPLGTLAANLLATALICAAFTASRAGSIPTSFAGRLTGCQALQGLQDGFCGCLSTVSTFAVELRTIKPRRNALRYALLSWLAGLLLCVLLLGAPWWSVGMDGRCLGYPM